MAAKTSSTSFSFWKIFWKNYFIGNWLVHWNMQISFKLNCRVLQFGIRRLAPGSGTAPAADSIPRWRTGRSSFHQVGSNLFGSFIHWTYDILIAGEWPPLSPPSATTGAVQSTSVCWASAKAKKDGSMSSVHRQLLVRMMEHCGRPL